MTYVISQQRIIHKQSLTYFRQVNQTSLNKINLVWAGSDDAVQSRWKSLHRWPHQQISCVHNLKKEVVMSAWQQLPFLTALLDPAENICLGLTKWCLWNQKFCFVGWVYRQKTDCTKQRKIMSVCLFTHAILALLLCACRQSFQNMLQ